MRHMTLMATAFYGLLLEHISLAGSSLIRWLLLHSRLVHKYHTVSIRLAGRIWGIVRRAARDSHQQYCFVSFTLRFS